MIAYIELPLRGTYTVNGHDILVIGLAYSNRRGPVTGPELRNGDVRVIFVDQDGSMGQATLSEVNINWRFDDKRRKWIDVDTGDDLGSDDDNGESTD